MSSRDIVREKLMSLVADGLLDPCCELIPCERCLGLNRNTPAACMITYGLYQAHEAGRPHHVLMLCHSCSKALYDGDGCVPLKNLVTAGLCHYVIEPIEQELCNLEGIPMSIQDDQERIRQAKDGDPVPVSAEFINAGCPMPVEIKAKRDLDYAVAEAAGLFAVKTLSKVLVSKRYLDKMYGVEDRPGSGCFAFSPSTDLNAAFEAAEKIVAKVWMKDQRDWSLSTFIGRDEHGWTCSLGCDEHRVFSPTPAMAICTAILKLKESMEETQ